MIVFHYGHIKKNTWADRTTNSFCSPFKTNNKIPTIHSCIFLHSATLMSINASQRETDILHIEREG